MGAYPTEDMRRQAGEELGAQAPAAASSACACAPEESLAQAAARASGGPCALIAQVEPESPADDAGFEPGCYLTSVDERPLRDIIDWRWLSADDVIELGYIDLDGEAGVVELEREEGEDWGFSFEGVLFDSIKLCRNACTFCFMRQLPPAMRSSLSLRDDDFRLSFLSGTFVTLTNLKPDDEARILEQRISPLRVSLHATDADARRALIGRHAPHGLAALDRLLAAGIEVHAQIVLVPEVNDGDVLRRTLEWAYARPGVLNIGIVPLGFTKFQDDFDRSFNDLDAARAVLDLVRPFQERAQAERGFPWVYAADEFYRNAYGADTAERVPPASHYGDFSLFEDGIGIIRSYVDEFDEACASGLAARAAAACDAAGVRVRYIVGEAMQPFLDRMLAESPLAGRVAALTVGNSYFGGNVDVTGLLCGCDIARAVRAASAHAPAAGIEGAFAGGSSAPDVPVRDLFVIPRVVLNGSCVTLDDMTVGDMEKAAGVSITVVSCNPLDYLAEIIDHIAATR